MLSCVCISYQFKKLFVPANILPDFSFFLNNSKHYGLHPHRRNVDTGTLSTQYHPSLSRFFLFAYLALMYSTCYNIHDLSTFFPQVTSAIWMAKSHHIIILKLYLIKKLLCQCISIIALNLDPPLQMSGCVRYNGTSIHKTWLIRNLITLIKLCWLNITIISDITLQVSTPNFNFIAQHFLLLKV